MNDKLEEYLELAEEARQKEEAEKKAAELKARGLMEIVEVNGKKIARPIEVNDEEYKKIISYDYNRKRAQAAGNFGVIWVMYILAFLCLVCGSVVAAIFFSKVDMIGFFILMCGVAFAAIFFALGYIFKILFSIEEKIRSNGKEKESKE